MIKYVQDHREPESAVRLFGVDLLAGLQQTHSHGFLHGDLNPSNVLIDEYGILKLSGFGLARSIPGAADSQDQSTAQGNQMVAAGVEVCSVRLLVYLAFFPVWCLAVGRCVLSLNY